MTLVLQIAAGVVLGGLTLYAIAKLGVRGIIYLIAAGLGLYFCLLVFGWFYNLVHTSPSEDIPVFIGTMVLLAAFLYAVSKVRGRGKAGRDNVH
ncbi:hypothetical protein H0X91_18130 [Burkholderia sp. 9777_1386]|uniref:hypothetical protein n=1 Tax=Burkholderia sp. 9777_1386 TaxID=2751183 RepID=UPI0018C405E9|nr:hypothetical protein [Burkholderia sp. 9777_1386]MBG0871890.1 hypothetical protein [Burkholderia sp. 9777_1386]